MFSKNKSPEKFDAFTPDTMIGGAVPHSGGDALESAWNAAAMALDMESVRIVCQVYDGWVYYLAAPAGSFSRHTKCGTPLAAAFPGHPLHRGDGVYRISGGRADEQAMSVLVSKGSFQVLGGYIQPHEAGGAPCFDVDADFADTAWTSHNLAGEEQSRATGWAVLVSGMATCLFGVVLVGVGLAFEVGYGNYDVAREQRLTSQLVNTSKTLIRHQPIHGQLANLSHVTTTIAKGGGWVSEYRIVKGVDGVWQATLPTWLTGDYWSQLGGQDLLIEAEPERTLGMIRATTTGFREFQKSKANGGVQ